MPATATLEAGSTRVRAKVIPWRRIGIIVGIVALFGAGGWWVLRSRASAAPGYRFAAVETGNIRQSVSATGTLSAVRTVQVGTQVSGQVAEIHADFNDHVTKGQLLARIDPTLQRQAVTDAEAQLVKAKAQQVQAQAEYDRNQPLLAQRYITATEFGTVDVALSVARAGAQSAQVTLERAKQNLSYTNIFAPISGVVIERDVDVGQTVAASLSAPQLFLIAQDLSRMQILAGVDESDIAAIKDSQVVNFTVQSFSGRTFVGKVGQVRLQSKLTDNVVNYTVVVALDNADGALLPGMTATVAFITGSATNVLTVPNLALRYKPTTEQLAAAGITASVAPTARSATDTASRVAGSDSAARRASAGATGGVRPPRPAGGQRSGVGRLYALDAAGKLIELRVRVGLSDGQRTQVTGESVTAGLQVIVGTTSSAATTTAPSANPLTPQRGGGRGP